MITEKYRGYTIELDENDEGWGWIAYDDGRLVEELECVDSFLDWQDALEDATQEIGRMLGGLP